MTQYNALGERLSNIEKCTNKLPKKTNDTSKITSSTKTGKHDQAAVTQQGFDGKVAHNSDFFVHDLTSQDREEARVQFEVKK